MKIDRNKLVLSRLFAILSISSEVVSIKKLHNNVEMLSAVLQELDSDESRNVIARLVERQVIALDRRTGKYNFIHWDGLCPSHYLLKG